MLVKSVFESCRGPAFDQVSELLDQRFRGSRAVWVYAAKCEDLLELVENQERNHGLVAGVPEVVVLAVKVFPEGIAGFGRWSFDVRRRRFAGNISLYLADQVGLWVREVQADIDREDGFAAQQGKETGLQQRGLAQAGKTEQNTQPFAHYQAEQFLDLGFAALEITLIRFAKGQQSRPRIVGAHGGRAGWSLRDPLFDVHQVLARDFR